MDKHSLSLQIDNFLKSGKIIIKIFINIFWFSNNLLEHSFADEPNNRGGENCVHVYTGDKKYGKWNDKECGTELGYICKKRRLGEILSPKESELHSVDPVVANI